MHGADAGQKVENEGPQPLGQRTSGRRFLRRQQQQEATKGTGIAGEGGDANENDDDEDEAAVATPTVQQQRRPQPEIELAIDAAIEARRQQRSAFEASLLAKGDGGGQKDNCNDVHGNHCNEIQEIVGNYEYLDHTADVQIHSYGDTFERALEQLVVGMFGYMTQLSLVEVNENQCRECHADNVRARGHDKESAVFNFLQEWLSLFHETGFVAREVLVVEFDQNTWEIASTGQGEIFDPARHTQGTEVKAVTYSNLQVRMDSGGGGGGADTSRCDIWVIVDI